MKAKESAIRMIGDNPHECVLSVFRRLGTHYIERHERLRTERDKEGTCLTQVYSGSWFS